MTFLENIEQITCSSDRISHWVVDGPTGTAEWDSEVTGDEPGRSISWASMPGASVDNAGTIEFKPATDGRGTEVRALISFKPPIAKNSKAAGARPYDDFARLVQQAAG